MPIKLKDRFPMIFALVSLVVIVTFSFATRARSSEFKFGYIDLQRIADESEAGKEINRKLNTLSQEGVSKIEEQEKEIQKLEQELRKKEFAITPDKKKEIEEEIRQKNLEIKFFKEAREKELKQFYLESQRSVLNQVLRIVQTIGQEEGYDLILTRDESGILYANPKLDLTDKVIQIYDQQIQK